MIDRIIEVGISCGIEVNVVTSKVKRFLRQPSPVQVVKIKNNWRVWNISTIWVA
jgi:hypothetical protein